MRLTQVTHAVTVSCPSRLIALTCIFFRVRHLVPGLIPTLHPRQSITQRQHELADAVVGRDIHREVVQRVPDEERATLGPFELIEDGVGGSVGTETIQDMALPQHVVDEEDGVLGEKPTLDENVVVLRAALLVGVKKDEVEGRRFHGVHGGRLEGISNAQFDTRANARRIKVTLRHLRAALVALEAQQPPSTGKPSAIQVAA